jgi:hypothetical protein
LCIVLALVAFRSGAWTGSGRTLLIVVLGVLIALLVFYLLFGTHPVIVHD